ncbi:hypothetical protein PPACK8108_LOCUS5659 [Phakopsora pachyrhizi]|uniref:Uncharacterized protein n=1 Tax=Phakopsora pachyrhizi TaxID=170000 RepID=A0AAV0AQY2_PHAPC|nr:hypothetical protein PPACK8108_LOCUS5659 [Phakopsora pachyrhizi]
MDKSAAETTEAQQQVIETLQQQIAATTIDNKTPFYHRINNFLNLGDNFDTLTPNEEVVVRTLKNPSIRMLRFIKIKHNEIGAAFLDLKLSDDAILGLFFESIVKGPNTVEANLFHQNVQAILNKENKVPTSRKTMQVIRVEYGKIKRSAGTFDDPITVSRAAVKHPSLAHNPVNTRSPAAKANYGDTCVVCKGTSHWYINCPLYEKQYIEMGKTLTQLLRKFQTPYHPNVRARVVDIATPEVVTANMANKVDEGVIMLDTGANKLASGPNDYLQNLQLEGVAAE